MEGFPSGWRRRWLFECAGPGDGVLGGQGSCPLDSCSEGKAGPWARVLPRETRFSSCPVPGSSKACRAPAGETDVQRGAGTPHQAVAERARHSPRPIIGANGLSSLGTYCATHIRAGVVMAAWGPSHPASPKPARRLEVSTFVCFNFLTPYSVSAGQHQASSGDLCGCVGAAGPGKLFSPALLRKTPQRDRPRGMSTVPRPSPVLPLLSPLTSPGLFLGGVCQPSRCAELAPR